MPDASVIEDMTIEVDGGYGEDGTQVRVYLYLTGDFTDSIEDYQQGDAAFILRLDYRTARKLAGEIARYAAL